MKKKLPAIFLFSLFICKTIVAQNNRYHPLRINSNITLDGKLEEPEWKQANMVDDFMQYDPKPGAAPSERTEVRIMYNDEFLFVGIRAFDHEPDKLIAVHYDRDFSLTEEDGTAFVIDTYNDKTTGISLVTNGLSARWDAELSADGGNENESFNTFWETATHVDSLGYTTEYQIPFSSLRFKSKDKVIMGFKIVRLIKRKNEYIIYPKCNPTIENAYFKPSLAKEMELENLKSKKPFYIIPYAIANYSEQYNLNSEGTAYEKTSEFMTRKNYSNTEWLDKIISNIGVDMKYGLSKNMTLDATINTDFAQAEVDDQIINLSKYEVNLPEKRTFFLESKNYLGFSTSNGNELFISRSIGREDDLIVPIVAGARVTGKASGWQMGMLDMQTTAITESQIDPHNFFVFRTRKDIDSIGSFVGGIFTNRINTNENKLSNQSIGIDLVKKIDDHIVVVGALSGTYIDASFSNFSESLYGNAAIFRSAKEGWNYNAGINAVGKSHNPVMGYIDENDYCLIDGGVGYQLPLSEKSNFTYWYVNTYEQYRFKMSSGKRETVVVNLANGLTFKNGADINFSLFEYKIDSLFDDWQLDDDNAISAGTYKMFVNSINVTFPQKSKMNSDFTASYGGFYGGKRIYFAPYFAYNFNRHFNAGVTYEYNHITFDKYLAEERNTVYRSNLLRLDVAYLLSTKLSVKLYLQFDDLSHHVNTNLRFRYNPKEGTDLYIVINQINNSDRSRLEPKLPVTDTQAIIIKFIKTIGI